VAITTPYTSRISGTGSYLPEKILTNADLEKMVDTNDLWIRERTGIQERHIAAADQATSDLGYHAALKAIEAAGIVAKDIDAILFATVTPDQVMPNTASYLQAKLGCRPIMAMDLSAACTGFLYALATADQFVRCGTFKHVLVVGAETLSRIINFKDRETCILFGDGAGAVVLSRSEDPRSLIYSAHLRSNGELGELLQLPAGGSRMPISHEAIDKNLQFVHMRGREIFKSAVRAMSDAAREALETNNMNAGDVNWFIFHQANMRIIEAVAQMTGAPMEKQLVNISRTGNTSSASIPIMLDQAVRDGRVKRTDHILLAAFGAGLTSGSILLRY
jgi:3-oxoacyl-[acyl-carrier-protein] synthase-3